VFRQLPTFAAFVTRSRVDHTLNFPGPLPGQSRPRPRGHQRRVRPVFPNAALHDTSEPDQAQRGQRSCEGSLIVISTARPSPLDVENRQSESDEKTRHGTRKTRFRPSTASRIPHRDDLRLRRFACTCVCFAPLSCSPVYIIVPAATVAVVTKMKTKTKVGVGVGVSARRERGQRR